MFRTLALLVAFAAALPSSACRPCGSGVRDRQTRLGADVEFRSSSGAAFDLGSAPIASANHWRDTLTVEWMVQAEGATRYHAALLLTNLQEGISGNVSLSQVATFVCDCGGPMLPSSTGPGFDSCLWLLSDGSSFAMSPQCMLLSGEALVRIFEQDCSGGGDKDEERCAVRADVEVVATGSRNRASFDGTLRVIRDEELIDLACLDSQP